MNRKYFLILFITFGFFFVLSSCSENNSPVTPPSNQTNNPTIVNTANTFSFMVNAQAFDFSKTENIDFSLDSLVFALTVSNYSGGSAVFKILDSSKNILRIDSITSNTVLTNVNLQINIPSQVSISLNRFSGNLTAVLVAKQSSSTFYKTDFPNMIGNSWKYSVYDSLANELDTVNVNISGEKILPNSVVSKIWTYSGGNFTDTNYVAFYGDTLKVFKKDDLDYPTEQIVFPLIIGKVWNFNGDTNRVKSIETVNVGAGNFNNAYHIFKKSIGLNFQLVEDLWVVPGVGIVKKNRNEFSLGPVENSHWELLDYGLNK